jgi:hypothetical protein
MPVLRCCGVPKEFDYFDAGRNVDAKVFDDKVFDVTSGPLVKSLWPNGRFFPCATSNEVARIDIGT